jgi:uncharacterized membrane protein YjdF
VAGPVKKWKLSNVDCFALFNLLLFILLCIFVYYDRFILYRGIEHILEFFIYAILIFLTIVGLWRYVRRYPFKNWTLILAEIGLLMHFAGGFLKLDNRRLYEAIFFGLTYDKYVHFTISLAASFLIQQLFGALNLELRNLENIIIICIVLGLGAVNEIVEYIITKTVPQNLVGLYDNNMQDLISNLAGGLCYLAINTYRKHKTNHH